VVRNNIEKLLSSGKQKSYRDSLAELKWDTHSNLYSLTVAETQMARSGLMEHADELARPE